MGFIPANVPLITNKGDMTLSTYDAPGFSPSLYKETVILPVQLYPGATEQISVEDATTVQGIMTDALMSAFSARAAGGPVVMGPTTTYPNALIVHTAITEIRPNKPMLNIAPQTQFRKRGYGYASVEMYVRAGVDGPVVAAFTSTTNTQRFSAEKFTPMGTADEAAKQWANEMVQLLK